MSNRLIQRGIGARADRALGRTGRGRSNVVVKGLSNTKTRRGVLAMAAYIARVEQKERADRRTEEEEAQYALGGARNREADLGDDLERERPRGPADSKPRGRRPLDRPDPLPLLGKTFGTAGPGPRRRSDRDDGDIRPTLRDEWGRIVPRSKIKGHLDGWSLLSDSQNLSKESRRDLADGVPILGRPAKRRLHFVQAHHLMFSAPCENRRDVASLELAVHELVREEFARKGYRALTATHLEHGRFPHVHVILEAMPTGRSALRLTPLTYDGLRADFADRLLALRGARLEASRRADRPEMLLAHIDALLSRPDAPAEADGRATAAWRRRVGLPDRGDALRAEAPAFVARHGASGRYASTGEAEQAGKLTGERRQRIDRLSDLLEPRFGEAAGGLARRWDELRSEAPHLADWYIRRRPERLADLTGGTVTSTVASRRPAVEDDTARLVDDELLAFLRGLRERRKRRGLRRPEATPARDLSDFGASRRSRLHKGLMETPEEVVARSLDELAQGLLKFLRRDVQRLEDAQSLKGRASDILEAGSLARDQARGQSGGIEPTESLREIAERIATPEPATRPEKPKPGPPRAAGPRRGRER